ncbi:MAG: hypothetical protein K2X93_15225 [Candidatus Obscuribacterales bacterium]|nr:hypothetical protein [Candidatus Obscuribacterales bacterium]
MNMSQTQKPEGGLSDAMGLRREILRLWKSLAHSVARFGEGRDAILLHLREAQGWLASWFFNTVDLSAGTM